ncbi:MAG: histidine phosphatase family protein [Proteobacteria bacterium]|nr:histidine phosphatase family protein [Pseudomonadota bacterium]
MRHSHRSGRSGSGDATAIALVRHGQAENNVDGMIGGHTDCALTDEGMRQAEAAAKRLADEFQPTAIVSSDLRRAHQTAEVIGRVTGTDIALDARLRERTLGQMDGLSFDRAAELFPEHWAQLQTRDTNARPPGGESLDQVFDRVSSGIDAIPAQHPGGRVVVVSHGLAIFHAFAHICGLGSPAQGLKVFFIVANASISRFTYHPQEYHPGPYPAPGGYWILDQVNDRSHLHGLTE